ncbi:LLM class flavin-dependent oxidoreductase [Bacillus sp. V2I10]|uniref:LLM class flavin-dependent oxidoreductase n=1 Tax=Bacillus sp. V2I10 TaxID=3042276 RepID=UPI0027815B54|nr:LLM class flavin-dependent oxidoreductase [Bacillus sp. V2I10]MDQ0862090.1 luciferase family oxidoreductase group 1 [Bacillus sp. V2I10]
MSIKLSILDQSPIGENETAADALKQTVELAILAEKWGYHRFWVSEHHNSEELAGSAPEALISYLLAKTKQIRIGSGGVMLQHYSPYKVAEIFNVLSSLAPGRVDLGIGKAPGGLPLSTRALQQNRMNDGQSIQQKISDLKSLMHNSLHKKHELYGVSAYPIPPEPAHLFLLGASENSAKLAAELNISFVYAQFINSDQNELKNALLAYLDVGGNNKDFHLALSIIVADTDSEAENLKGESKLIRVNLESGRHVTVKSIEQAEKFAKQAGETYSIEEQEAAVIYGSKESVRRQVLELQKTLGVKEFIVSTPLVDAETKQKSYSLLGEAFSEEAGDSKKTLTKVGTE